METLQITQDAIRYGNEMHPTKNISSARMVERFVDKPMPGPAYRRRFLKHLVVGGVVLLLGMRSFGVPGLIASQVFGVSAWQRSYPFTMNAISVAFWIVFALVLLRGLLKPQTRNKEYGVELQNTAGRVSLFWSADRPFIEEIRDLIFKAISSSGNVNYTVNIDKQEINNHSLTLNETTINNDYSVHFTENHGVTPEQLAYLNRDVTKAIQDLSEVLKKESDSDAREELRELVEAMRTAQPGKEVGLKKSWSRLTRACNDYSAGRTIVGDLLSVIGKGVEILM